MIPISKMAAAVQPSATLAAGAKARQLRAEGVQVDDRIEEYEYGRFAWTTDPEGNRFELWEPPKKS